MYTHFWIWHKNFPSILQIIAIIADFNLDDSTIEEINYGMCFTSSDKDHWFEFVLNTITLKIAYDEDDRDIVVIQLDGNLNYDLSNLLSRLGTDFEMNFTDPNQR